jgi:hypothetical protein
VRTNAKSGARKTVGLDPPVSRTGTTRSKPKKTPAFTADSSETIPSDSAPSTEDIAKLAYALGKRVAATADRPKKIGIVRNRKSERVPERSL